MATTPRFTPAEVQQVLDAATGPLTTAELYDELHTRRDLPPTYETAPPYLRDILKSIEADGRLLSARYTSGSWRDRTYGEHDYLLGGDGRATYWATPEVAATWKRARERAEARERELAAAGARLCAALGDALQVDAGARALTGAKLGDSVELRMPGELFIRLVDAALAGLAAAPDGQSTTGDQAAIVVESSAERIPADATR